MIEGATAADSTHYRNQISTTTRRTHQEITTAESSKPTEVDIEAIVLSYLRSGMRTAERLQTFVFVVYFSFKIIFKAS